MKFDRNANKSDRGEKQSRSGIISLIFMAFPNLNWNAANANAILTYLTLRLKAAALAELLFRVQNVKGANGSPKFKNFGAFFRAQSEPTPDHHQQTGNVSKEEMDPHFKNAFLVSR